MSSTKKWEIIGGIFQVILMGVFLYRTFAYFNTDIPKPISAKMFSYVGMAIFGYCLYILYCRGKRLTELLKTGIFKYTRHPMYTGLAFMDISIWFVADLNMVFLISAAIFYFGLIAAGYCQEKETVARFSAEAKEYYTKTPRFFFWYPIQSLFAKTG